MTDTLRAAAIQMVSSDVVADNLEQACALVGAASADGARLVVLPENFAFMGADDTARLAHAEPPGSGVMQDFLAHCAREHGVWLVGGTIPLEAGAGRAYAAMLVCAPDGRMVQRYDKMHLFDVDLPPARYRESGSTVPGEAVAVVATDFGGLGLAVCYDLRFPELFRKMSQATVFAVASAFTVPTGEAHWETLVRARAIENQTALVAACQGGAHAAGRQTYGHSMIVDAWGRILGERAEGAGIVVADIDLAEQRRLRARFPVLQHKRLPELTEDSTA